MMNVIEVRIIIERDGNVWSYRALHNGVSIMIQGSANDQRTAEARAYLGCSEYFLDLFDRTAP